MLVKNLTLVQIAEECGLMSLSPSDLVFESNPAVGITYYDYVLSARCTDDDSSSWYLYLCKLDSRTNVESMQTLVVSRQQLASYGIPADYDVQLMTLGVLVWKEQIAQSRLLCLLSHVAHNHNLPAFEALKRATKKFKCTHHVLTLIGNGEIDRDGAGGSGRRYSASSMQLRVMMCQTRMTTTVIPNQALRETKCLLVPTSNPILCMCFPIT